MTPRVALVGAGGHAKVVLATARAVGWDVVAVFDDERARWGEPLLGVAISGPTEQVLADAGATAILAIGDNSARAKLAASARCRFATLVHPHACVDASVRLGVGCVVFAGAVIQPDTRLGRHVVVNTSASIDHDCELADYVHVAPGANLCGGVHLDDGVLVGVGAAVLPGRRIGEWTTVGGGAVVVGDLEARITVVGVPARRVKSNP